MNRYTALVAGLALAALVAITYLVVSRGGGTIEAEGAGGKVTIKGEATPVPPTGRIRSEDTKARGTVSIKNETGGDVDTKRTEADGDINISTGSQEAPADPK